MDDLYNCFKNIDFRNDIDTDIDIPEVEDEFLDASVTEIDINHDIKRLKINKSGRVDSIVNEHLAYLNPFKSVKERHIF